MSIRIEQVPVASTLPDRDITNRRLPRGLADVRRLAARALLGGGADPGRTQPVLIRGRRNASCLALAAAALAVPTLPGTAAAAAHTGPSAAPPALQARHHHVPGHVPQHMVLSDPNTVSFQRWSASGWTLSGPQPFPQPLPSTGPDQGREQYQYPMVDPRCLEIPHHHRCTPWAYHPDAPASLTNPDGTGTNGRPTDDTYRVTHTSPRSLGTESIPDLPRPGASPEQQPSGPVNARSRPLATVTATATGAVHPSADALLINMVRATYPTAPSKAAVVATPGPTTSTCLRAAHLPGKDSSMLAHLPPAADAMGVVLNHRRTACAPKVDYLSQARA